MSKSCLATLLLLLLLHLLCPVTSRPQVEESLSLAVGGAHGEQVGGQLTRRPQDPLRWIWLDGTSLSLEWPARFSLSINGAVTAYSLSLTQPHQSRPFLTTTMFHAATLRHQFEGLRSNMTYEGRLMALVGPHHWPYTLLNFTVTSPTLLTGLSLGQRAHPNRPRSSTADLDAITVSVTLRWSSTPFLKGNKEGEIVQPTGYRLLVWDQKKLVTQVITEASPHSQDCEAAVGALELDSVYKATLDAILPDGEPGVSLTFSLDAGALHVAGGGLTTDGVSECYSSLQVRCPGSERCVSPYWICDGAPDCPEGVDELGCDTTLCDGFQCWEDVCIPWAWRCDGQPDCKGGDDEYACPSCEEGELQCPWGGPCLQRNATCDGVDHCRDGWDESVALCGSVTCKPGELQCLGGSRCVPHDWLCDGVSDCPAAEDEDATFCSAFNTFKNNLVFNSTNESPSLCEEREAPKKVNCTNEEFRCDTSKCILREYLCDGVRDCENGRDELPESCSLAPTQPAKAPKFRFDSEEDLSDADQHVDINQQMFHNEEMECNEEDGDLCRNVDTQLINTQTLGEEHSTTTDRSEAHTETTSTTQKPEPEFDYDNSIEDDDFMPDVKTSPQTTATTTTTTTTTSTTTLTTTSTTTTPKTPFLSIIEANMTDVGGNEIDIDFIKFSDTKSLDEDNDVANKTQSGDSVNVEDFMQGEEVEKMENEEKPSLLQPESGLNLSSSEEYDDEESYIPDIEMDSLSPHDSGNVSDAGHGGEEGGFTQATNETTLQKPDVLIEEVNSKEIISSEESDASEKKNATVAFLPQPNTTTEGPVEASTEQDDSMVSEEDNVILFASEGPVTVQMVSTSEETTGTEATVINVTLPLLPDDTTTTVSSLTTITTTTSSTTTTQGSSLPDVPATERATSTPLSSPDLTPTPEATHLENTSLPTTPSGNVAPEGDVTPEESSLPGDMTSPNPVTAVESDTTTTTSTTTTTATALTTSPSMPTITTPIVTTTDKPEAATPTTTQETTTSTILSTSTTDQPAPSTTTPSFSTTTQPTTESSIIEMGQKNLTILIAIRAGMNETEIPQYTIHGADGNTYQYEIVSIVKEEGPREENRPDLTLLEEEEEMTNEIRGDGSHQFLQGIHISSATRSSSYVSSFFVLLLVSFLVTVVGFDVK